MAARSHGPVLGNPGWVATVFTVLIVGGFLGALYASAQGHHEGGHEGGAAHGAAEHPAPTRSQGAAAAEHH
jgi:hypothetical protein